MKSKNALAAVAITFVLVAVALVTMGMQPGVAAGPPFSVSGPTQGNTETATLRSGSLHYLQGQTNADGTPHPEQQGKGSDSGGDGSLQVVDHDGKSGLFCPLKHTDVKAEISGFLARVVVTQEFTNPAADNVEAVYVFPLPQNAAVDDMTLHVGDRLVKSLIKKRDEAQKIYNDARNAGHTAALLNQERPNIFTQSVANIAPGANVKVEISYVETLKYEAGSYEFVFPMVVGPRYIPGAPVGTQAGGWAPDTNQVPDASRITPPVAGVHYGVKGTRAGHDISLAVKLDAGVPIKELRSASHDVNVDSANPHTALVQLKSENEIPNRDFILKYDVSGGKIEDALLVHADANAPSDDRGAKGSEGDPRKSGYFTFILQPPDRVRDEDATQRELIFVLDTSGSMYGFPLETAKKTMKRAIEHLRPGDTFNLITFSGDTHILFPSPVLATTANLNQAIQFIDGQRGGGGTEMMKAIRAALGEDQSHECGQDEKCLPNQRVAASDDRTPVRVVCFMTDGYVGNDMQIIAEVQKHPEARVFSFGIGTAVNRFLLEGMAKAGRGEVEFVTNQAEAEPAADRFYERVHTPVLTDIAIDWNGLPVTDVIPARPLDLFSAKPLLITGRYSGGASGVIRLRGKRAGKAFAREIKVNLPASEPANSALAQLWARNRIENLMSQDWSGVQQGNTKAELRDEITQLGLDYRLVTQFTSFVAVEEKTVVEGGRTRTIQVPVEMPQGVSTKGVFGQTKEADTSFMQVSAMAAPVQTMNSQFAYKSAANGTGYAGGVGGGALGGVLSPPPKQMMPMASASESVTVESRAVSNDRSLDRDDRKQKKDKAERGELESKLHPGLLAVYDCWLKAGKSSTAQCGNLRQGRIAIDLWLTNTSPTLMKQLQQLGFVSSGNKSGQLKGTLPIDKLQSLARMKEVKLVALEK